MKYAPWIVILSLLAACSQVETTPTPTVTLVPTPTPTPIPTPTFDAAKLGSGELDVTYCSPDGRAQKLDIYYPSFGGPWPVLLYVHGGSWREGDKAEGEGWRGLNEQGILVASVNYRMAAEGKFPVMIEDVQCAVRYLRAHSADYNLDPNRMAAVGASAGGHLVALLGTADDTAVWNQSEYAEQSSRVQAVITMAGLFDFTVNLPSGINSAVYYAFGKLAGDGSPEMAAASPVTYVTADDPPFLILHGDRDGVVPVAQSKILHERLTAVGVPATLVIVQNGDHSLGGANATPTQAEINEMIAAFLAEIFE
ncbi:MAG: alpha/beta hydrolase [Chloroflexi bacterium]|nr:alpha/beta hydrolase [Ardenticatenaceae bacterium]MBL1131245.1 alpha/beta hydrolase [Chloroflexota bacterium]NOG37345.1 alpha/beta hydrolase [Chloroflexota bacterium]